MLKTVKAFKRLFLQFTELYFSKEIEIEQDYVNSEMRKIFYGKNFNLKLFE